MEKKEQVSSDRILMIVDTYESDNRMGGGAQSILCYKPFNYQR